MSGWNPALNGAVYSLASVGNVLYAAGYFSRVGGGGAGGSERDNIAAVDLNSGEVTPWNPGADSWANSVIASGSTVYVGGAFTRVGGVGRNGVAALDAATGGMVPWSANADGEVKAVAAVGGRVYVGGYFQHICGQPRAYLAALDVASGSVTAWDPHADASVWSLAAIGQDVYVGGVFTSINGFPCSSLAAVTDSSGLADAPTVAGVGKNARPTAIQLQGATPSPMRSACVIRFALPDALPVSLTLYDLQGRVASTPLRRIRMNAGQHDVKVRADGLAPGCYLCSLSAGGRTATMKIVVVR